ncbi:MAG TPA: ABC transporter substrate-binding protein, partial [Spirillospora sp.]|nr:ABC transporter substrate-binding protein [Spirillospora sp.]
MKRPILFFMLLLLMLVPLSAGAQDAETVVIRGFGNIDGFNPLLHGGGASFQAYSLLWPTATDIDRFTGEAIPGLTTWEISEDGLTYTFTIRDDAVWSDGTPITS